jgi:riboflavin biosynthesis pyrimidine reductase
VWETPDVIPHRTAAVPECTRICQGAEKIVYSPTLQTVSAAKTRLERRLETDVVGKFKAGASRDIAMGGPTLAAHAIRAGLVDEYHLLIAPIIAGGGNPYLPGKVRVKLELLDERRFDNGLVHVRYRAKS